jgi:hypothetical protein
MRMRREDVGPRSPHRGAQFRPPPALAAVGAANAVRDEQLGRIFRNMRLAMKVPRETIARRLAIRLSTLDDLEAGAVAALPHWKETVRIVRTYCELLRLDPQPILWRIQNLQQAASSRPAAAVAPLPTRATNGSGGTALPPAAAVHRGEPAPGRRVSRGRRRARAFFALSAPIALAGVVIYLAQTAPQPLYRVVMWFPAPIQVAARAGVDSLVLLMAPRRDGLRWIEVADPRSRKADKLQTGR